VASTSEPIVITGMGLITALGLTGAQTWAAVCEARSGMGPMPALEQPLPPGQSGGQCPDLPADFAAGLPREARYLRRAITDALADAAIIAPWPYGPSRCGMMIGTTLHGMRGAGEYFRKGDTGALSHFLAAAVLEEAAGELPIRGPALTTCSACSSSLGSIAMAVALLQSGQLDLVVAGGYDTVSEYVYGGFNSLRLVAAGPQRPFARDRDGMKLSEGYGIVILERLSAALDRGARLKARILGAGESADAHHLTQPHPEGDGAARAMASALAMAGLSPANIGLVAAHATATRDNDAGEYAALARVLGSDLSRIPVVGFKSHLGHTLGGAGAVELILSALAMRHGILPPTANVRPEDVEFPGLQLTHGQPIHSAIAATMNNSLGFGGANTCVVLGSPEPKTQDRAIPSISARSGGQAESPRPDRPVCITGIGVIFPGIVGSQAWLARLAGPAVPAFVAEPGAVAENDILPLLNARRVRRMSDYVKLTLAATALACTDAGANDRLASDEQWNVLLGTTHGSAAYSGAYYRQIVQEGIPAANPMLFAEGVPNSAAAHVSLSLSIKGACQTVIGSRTAGLDALRLAAMRIASGQWDRVIVGAAEEFDPLINTAYSGCGMYRGAGGSPAMGDGGGFACTAGAVSFILESRDSALRRGVRARAWLESCSATRVGPSFPTAPAIPELRGIRHVMTSANATTLDRFELASLSRSRCEASVSTPYGHIGEAFSVMPLASIAAVALSGRLPRLLAEPRFDFDGLSAARGDERPEEFTVLASDYTGLLAAARLRLTDTRSGCL
jgi:3-oxoacyl-[acyl-carrier-protein] synthase II